MSARRLRRRRFVTQREQSGNKSVRPSRWRRRHSTHWSGKLECRCAVRGEECSPLRTAHDKPAYWSIPYNRCGVITSKGATCTLNIDPAVNVLLFRTISRVNDGKYCANLCDATGMDGCYMDRFCFFTPQDWTSNKWMCSRDRNFSI